MRMSFDQARASEEKTLLNSERAKRRRAVARTVKDVRSKLGSSEGSKPAFDYELMALFTKNRRNATYALPLFAMVVASISALWAPAPLIVVWLCFTLVAHSLMLCSCRRFETEEPTLASLEATRRQLIIGDFLCGICWAFFFLLPPVHAAQNSFEVFQFATMLVVIAMATMFSSSLPRALFAATFPVTIAIIVSFLNEQTPIHYAMTAMAIGAQGFFLILGNQLRSSEITTLEYRLEKDHLIAELEQANAVSDESRRRAEEANLAKSRFLATMSHELRTPLNAILGFSEVMKNEVLGPMYNTAYCEYAGDIHSSGQHLLNVINEILDLSRIEAGRCELNEELVQLTSVLNDCLGMMTIRANKKSITLHEAHEPNLPKIWVDARAVRQIILNLISNAVKFTPSGGDVTIKVGWTNGGGQYVSVSDNGPGIAEEELPLVMQAFGQGSISVKTAEEGSGLGLSIVQALVHMHSGNFELRSKLREGTEALVTFPSTRVLEATPAYSGASEPAPHAPPEKTPAPVVSINSAAARKAS